jgi:hypothetical protein
MHHLLKSIAKRIVVYYQYQEEFGCDVEQLIHQV